MIATEAPAGTLAVSCRGVGKDFGRGDARVQVDLDVITGLLDQTSGEVSVLGVELASREVAS